MDVCRNDAALQRRSYFGGRALPILGGAWGRVKISKISYKLIHCVS